MLDPSEQEDEKSLLSGLLDGFLCWHRVWTRGKGNYLYIISLAALHVLLISIIVHEMHEKGTKWVKFYLNFRFIRVVIQFHTDAFRCFPLCGFLDGFGFRAGSFCRFLLRFLLLKRIITLFKSKKKGIQRLYSLKISRVKRKNSTYSRRFVFCVKGV